MEDPCGVLEERVSTLLDITARIPGGIVGLTAADDDAVVDVIEAAQLIVQSAQAIFAAGAGELDRRSQGTGEHSLAGRLGWRTARGVIAAKAGITFGEAARAVSVGQAIRPHVARSGGDLPADRPHVAAALLAGDLTLQMAQLVDRTLEALVRRLSPDLLTAVEEQLVTDARSGRYSVADFTAYCRELIDRFDPEGAKDRADARKDKAFIHETWLTNGMLRIVAELDPETAAFYLTAMRARTNPRKPATDSSTAGTTAEPEDESGATVTDIGARRVAKQPTRTEAKLMAFTTIMRDAVKAEHGDQAGIDTTILVRMDLAALLSGIGSATIDGIPTPISASAARRLAAEADLIPQVLDGKSQLLDHGESKREFTKAQRYAILANYRGCAFPHCDIPSSMLEFHHIGGWKTRHSHGKGTDLENGIPLCGFHNRLMEKGWDIEFDDDGIPWFIPPRTLDPTRTPIRAGNLIRRRAA